VTKIEQFNALVRGVVTLGLTAAFITGFLYMKIIGSEAFLSVFSGVITWWFISRDQKNAAPETPKP